MRRTKSFGRASGISYLRSTEHTRETPETHFIRNATGRGSIKKPAPTKAFLLRMQVRPVYSLYQNQGVTYIKGIDFMKEAFESVLIWMSDVKICTHFDLLSCTAALAES